MQSDQFERVDCPLCRSGDYKIIMAPADRFSPEAGRIYTLTRCAHCDFVFLNPRPKPEALAQFYAYEAYQPFLSTQSRLTLWQRLYTVVRRFAVRNKRLTMERRLGKGCVLDVGCGTGEFLDEMQRNGWQARGVERDPVAARFAREHYRLRVETGELGQLEAGATFDAITFWHVLEHLHDPLQAMASASRHLRDGGIIWVAVPNISGIDARFYRENWIALDAPRHLHHFTPATMGRLAEAVNLKVVECRQMIADAFFNCLMSEKLLLSQSGIGKAIRLPFGLLRGKVMAWISVLSASSALYQNLTNGSSILYFIEKKEDVA